MKIALGCDHGGFALKEIIKAYLIQNKMEVADFGCYDPNAVDYPEVAAKASRTVANGENDYGILICSTGIGISISANKISGIRAALCTDTHCAEMTRRHNNANVLCLGGHVVTEQEAKRITDVFLSTDFEGDRHQRRIDLITAIEDGKL